MSLVVSGASRRADETPVAHGYAAAAQALGVPAERIVVLDTLGDTAQGAYAVRHFERAGLAPIPAPTGFKTGSERVRMLAYWLPSAGNLRKTERAVHETLGLLALELDHRGR